uniref:Uncharacterized protein n=1 Tax=Cuerna arida TaxID=1464854 RepID=A0A1B6FBK3_9HEMI
MKFSGFSRIMVKVNCICFVVALFVRGTVSRGQETTELPNYVPGGSLETGSARGYPSSAYGDYGTLYGGGYTKQYKDYTAVYGDYLSPYGDYGDIGYDDGTYDENSYEQYDDIVGDIFAYGDRNNPKDAVQQMNAETDISDVHEMPWVYIIVPVVQIDVFYVDDEKKALEDLEIQLPIETFFFELGNFGMGHLDLLDFELSEMSFAQDSYTDYLQYDDYPTMGHYPNSDLYETADQLNDWSTLDYPGIDHEPYWIDWIFMMPPEEMNPIV